VSGAAGEGPAGRGAGARVPRATRPPRPLGVRLIVLYKAVKAVAELALAAGLLALAASGEVESMRELAAELRHHVASRWSLLAGRALGALASARGVHLLELGLVLDAALSAVEGWSLWRGYRWGEWLVVVATATPLPLEVLDIARSHRLSRVVLAVVNAAVVVYLARRIGQERREDRGPGG
jgi:uncharacterized membrane protein (DUF2068 family)